ncbi:hypothetical protein AB0H77_17235 [Streptomyces sp. NPDC050844]
MMRRLSPSRGRPLPEPATRTARVLDGTPADIGSRDWRVLSAG